MRQLLIAGVVLLAIGFTAVVVAVFNRADEPGQNDVGGRATTSTVLQESLPGSDELRRGDIPGARGVILAHLEQNPDDLRARYLLALTYERQGDAEGAVQVYEDIAVKDERNFEAHFRIGLLQRGSDDLSGATASFRKALELNDDFTAARVALAEVSAEAGETDRAIALYFEVIEDRPLGTRLDQVRTALASLLVEEGQRENAVLQLERALAESPDNIEARRLLDTLQGGASTPPPEAPSTSSTIPADEN